MDEKELEQLCIKKTFLKEEECKLCKGYDSPCPNYEGIKVEYNNLIYEKQKEREE